MICLGCRGWFVCQAGILEVGNFSPCSADWSVQAETEALLSTPSFHLNSGPRLFGVKGATRHHPL